MTARKQNGFTLVELVIVITVLGILAAVAAPKFFDFTGDSKDAALQGALGGVRSAISNFYAHSATPSGGGVAKYPTLIQLTTPGVVMADSGIPDNPYSTGRDRNVVRAHTLRGVAPAAGTTGAWCYAEDTGEFWADTYSGASESKF